MQGQKLKKVDGNYYPASDFAYVPDPEEPSTWKLPIFDMHHVGGAEAAVNTDYRGREAEIPPPAMPEVRRRIQERKAQLMDKRQQ